MKDEKIELNLVRDSVIIIITMAIMILVSLWASFSSWSDSKLARREIETLKVHMGQSFGMINELDKRQSLLGFQIVSIDTTIKHKTYSLKMHQDGHGEWIEEKVEGQ